MSQVFTFQCGACESTNEYDLETVLEHMPELAQAVGALGLVKDYFSEHGMCDDNCGMSRELEQTVDAALNALRKDRLEADIAAHYPSHLEGEA